MTQAVAVETTAVENMSTDQDEVEVCEEKAVGHVAGQSEQVKTNVLTHIIEGFLIKESSEPFPLKPIVNNVNDGYQPKQLVAGQEQQSQQAECAECGKKDHKEKFTKTEPHFCSVQCQKQNSKTSVLNGSKGKRPVRIGFAIILF